MSYSVIIPSNNFGKVRRSVDAIITEHANSKELNSMVIVEDSVTDWNWNWASKVNVVGGKKPFIYARNVNIGIAAAPPEDDIVIVGDDVLVKTLNAFDLLAQTARSRVGVACVSPSIIGPVGNPLQKARASSAIIESPTELCFVCVYIPRDWLDKVGELDERFVGYGCEDVDWCWRAKDLGGRFIVDGRATVLHNDVGMPSAFRDEDGVAEKGQKALAILRDKWPGRVP